MRHAPPHPETDRRLRWKVWAPVLLGAAFLPFLIGYLFAERVIFPPPEIVGEGVPVPPLRGSSEAEARQALTAAGLGELLITRLPHPDLAEGEIIAQSPLAGQQLRPGAAVRVAVSSGVPRVLVPDVFGFHVDRATGLLDRLGFTVLRTDMESEAPAGRVLEIVPGPGTRLPLPSEVTLTVSTGPPLAVPDTGLIGVDTGGVRVDTLVQRPGTTPHAPR